MILLQSYGPLSPCGMNDVSLIAADRSLWLLNETKVLVVNVPVLFNWPWPGINGCPRRSSMNSLTRFKACCWQIAISVLHVQNGVDTSCCFT